MFMPKPAEAMFVPELFVSPSTKKFYAPCVVSTEFDISVKIFNQEEETGYAVYAFDFWLYWMNSTEAFSQGCIKQSMIKLVKIEVKPPWPEGQYFIIKNETGNTGDTEITKGGYTSYWNYYHLAITALNTAPPLTDIKAAVVDLTFHIEDEPVYPEFWETPFVLGGIKMSYIDPVTGEPKPIVDVLGENGLYYIKPKAPEMWVVTEKPMDVDADGVIDYYYIVRWTNCTWFTVDIVVKNVGKMFSFCFHLYYDASLLNTDAQHIHIKDFLPPPYEILIVEVLEVEHEESEVHVEAKRPLEKPGVCGSGTIVSIDFHTKCPTYSGFVYKLPTSVKSFIGISCACIDFKYVKCGTTITGETPLTAVPAEYYFKPKVEDLDQSGHVDVVDLTAIAKQYGVLLTENEWAPEFTKLAAETDEPVDLFDVVAVAKQFCKPYTPKDPYTGEPYDP
jgi:hypothetical protein